MSAFLQIDAAFEGFRITRERPKALLIWTVFSLIISMVTPVLLILLGLGDNLEALEATANSKSADPAAALENLRNLLPFYALLIPFSLTFQSMIAAAIYRTVLHPEDSRLGYLRLGRDELRLVILSVIYTGLAVLAVFVVALLGGIASAIASKVGLSAPLIGIGLGFFLLGILVYVAVRMSLAPIITFSEGRLAIFESWALTRGHFWSITLSYLVAFFSVIAVILLATVIFMVLAAIAAGGNFEAVGALFKPDLSSLAAYFTPARVLYSMLGALLTSIYYAVVIAPGALIYHSLNMAPAKS